MRPLRYVEDGKLTIERFNDGFIPPDTIPFGWRGGDFAYITNGDTLGKAGCEKIRVHKHGAMVCSFSGRVDACSVDKAHKADLTRYSVDGLLVSKCSEMLRLSMRPTTKEEEVRRLVLDSVYPGEYLRS